MTRIVLDVLGTPAPKGSGRAMLIAGKARFIASGTGANAKQLKSWRSVLVEAASRCREKLPLVDTALEVMIVFRMPRPKGHYGSGRNAETLKLSAPSSPRVYPDIDKLARGTLDPLTGIVWDDDSRIVELLLRKEYADPGYEGARIIVQPAQAYALVAGVR